MRNFKQPANETKNVLIRFSLPFEQYIVPIFVKKLVRNVVEEIACVLKRKEYCSKLKVFVKIMKITGSVLIADVKKSFVSIRFVYLQISDTHVSSTLQKYSFREIKKKIGNRYC